MQRVRLLGELGERFGAEYTYYNLRHPADAIKLLCINRPDFKDYLLKSEENGVGFRVVQSEVDMDYPDLLLPIGRHDLTIVPVLTGSGGGGGKILAGIGLVAFSILTAGAGTGFLGLGAGLFGTAATGPLAAGFAVQSGFILGAAASSAIGAIGASLVLGGVAQMLSPQPQLPSFGGFQGGDRFGSRNRTGGPVAVTRGLDGQQSYAYTGAANTVGIGATVPLAYGEVLIGSHLLRSKIEVSDESDPTQINIKQPGPDTILIGGEKVNTTGTHVSGAFVQRISPDKTTFKSIKGAVINNTNQTIPLQINKTASTTITSNNTYRELFNVALSLPNSLYNYAGGVGTTKVDAYITYEISVYYGSVIEESKLIAQDITTIQGLLLKPQNFTWKHQMKLPSQGSTITQTVQVKIIDTDAFTQVPSGETAPTLNFLAVGYSMS